MGRAMAAALIGKGVCTGGDILVVEPDADTREANANLGCLVQEVPGPEVGEAKVVLLAVKPQTAPEVYPVLQPLLSPGQVVVSIMAGVTIGTIQSGLSHDAIVRVMPNTPSQVGLGMNVYHAAPAVEAAQLEAVEALLQSSGESLAVESEDAIDAATAVSGSGPAYVFYMAEAWTRAAIQLGFSEQEATQLVQQTLIGATALWRTLGTAPETLRAQVTSKGGTTAAALEHMEGKKIGKHFEDGVMAAYKRAKELGKG